MLIKDMLDDRNNYYKDPSMCISTDTGGFKVAEEAMSNDTIIQKYLADDSTNTIVIVGVNTFGHFWEMFDFISRLRSVYKCDDTIVIYTDVNKTEISLMIDALKPLRNIIVKFGKEIQGEKPVYNDILGVWLSSPNQYVEVVC